MILLTQMFLFRAVAISSSLPSSEFAAEGGPRKQRTTGKLKLAPDI